MKRMLIYCAIILTLLPFYSVYGEVGKLAPLSRIRNIYENQALSDEVIVSSLVMELDNVLTVPKIKMESKAPFSSRVVLLTQLIAYPHNKNDISKRVASIKIVSRNIKDKILKVEKPDTLIKYLMIAEALAGGKVATNDLIDILDDPMVPNGLTPQILSALEVSGMPICMLPHLVDYLKDTQCVLMDTEGVGAPPQPRRVYPIRSAACSGIRSLGIECKETYEELPNQNGIKQQQFEIDEKSLNNRLAIWIAGDDIKQSKEAICAASNINLISVKKTLERLSKDEQLREEIRGEIKIALSRMKPTTNTATSPAL